MKSKDKKDTSLKFQKDTADQEFKKLMNRSGVNKLKKNEKIKKSQIAKKSSEPIKFESEENWKPLAVDKSIYKKHSTTDKPVKQTKSGKKKKLTPGFIPDAEIDLHGDTREKARQKIDLFLLNSHRKRCKVILIITGRGLGSDEGEGVLRKEAWKRLGELRQLYNIQFKWAPVFLGGNGAIVVFFN